MNEPSEESINVKEAQLLEARKKGLGATLRVFLKFSGPGWLQSAITLGGGSLAGAMFLGVVGGYSMLWVQACALLMGVVMLSAIGYVSLSTEESPFQKMRREINPVLAWGWILATLAANMVWVLPQYSLAYGAFTENLVPGFFENPESIAAKMKFSFAILLLVSCVTFLYGKEGLGMKVYEWMLKMLVGLVVFSFIGVVIKIGLSGDGLPWGEIIGGFVPNLNLVWSPSAAYQSVLDTISNDEVRAYWSEQIVAKQRTVIIAAASAAVGINMTFMLPFSMRAKKWTKNFRGLASFDLATGMIIPFVLATSCIVIASGYLFHGQTYNGLLDEVRGEVQFTESPALAKQVGEVQKMLDTRVGTVASDVPTENGELKLGAMLLNRSNAQFARSLETLVGPQFAHLIFGAGVFGMALSTISVLMLISGFVVCEIFGFAQGSIQQKLGSLLGATGILWPYLWSGSSKAYLAIPTSLFGYTLLPIAFLAFILMMNSKKALGDEMPRGRSRVIWNTLMFVSFAVTGLASSVTAWGKKLAIGGAVVPVGKIFLISFVVAVVLGHFYIKSKHRKSE